MHQPTTPWVALPTPLSDEAAAQLYRLLTELLQALECHYAERIHRYQHTDHQQYELWDNDPPF